MGDDVMDKCCIETARKMWEKGGMGMYGDGGTQVSEKCECGNDVRIMVESTYEE